MNQWSLCYPAFLLTWFVSLTTTFKQQGGCYFPEKWEGSWFQSGIWQPVVIEGSRISSKGRCLATDGDKFLVLDEKRACYRCVVIHQKHENVLQYKETFCHSRNSLSTLCSYISGDALLYSMFRENATPVQCPFKGPFTFTYNRGYGECRSPVSNIDSCTEDSKLLISYQACPDVPKSESTVEELQCLAAWKEGSTRYLVGKVNHIHATSNEDRFRCFVYEKASASLDNPEMDDDVEFRVAQSGDATCNGLFSATEGSRTMTLKKAPSTPKCHFPPWVTGSNHWHTLDHSATFSFHRRDALKITNATSGLEIKIVCSYLRYAARNESTVVLLTHFTMGCQNGYMCMSFNRRDAHVIEAQIGVQTKRSEEACSPPNFNVTNQSYITLVTTSPETRACPYMGKFVVNNLIRSERSIHTKGNPFYELDTRYFDDLFEREGVRVRRKSDPDLDCDNRGFTSLVIGCRSLDTMEFGAGCASSGVVTSYACHGRWEENGTNYLIATPIGRSSHGARRFCFIYRERSPNLVLFSSSAASCDRVIRPGVTGELVFNITSIGNCMISNSAVTKYPTLIITLAMLSVLFVQVLKQIYISDNFKR